MRELRFRAWDKKHKQWFDDFHIRASGQWAVYDSEDGGKSGLWEHDISDDYDLEIMQFTGLKDKNGREIYEGDILCFTGLSKFHQRPFVIEWNERQARWTEYDPKDQAEVIGNIYQDSHLLDNHKDM